MAASCLPSHSCCCCRVWQASAGACEVVSVTDAVCGEVKKKRDKGEQDQHEDGKLRLQVNVEVSERDMESPILLSVARSRLLGLSLHVGRLSDRMGWCLLLVVVRGRRCTSGCSTRATWKAGTGQAETTVPACSCSCSYQVAVCLPVSAD